MKTLLRNFHFTVEWKTILTKKERKHTIDIVLHRCSTGANSRDSIQIILPKNITVKDASLICKDIPAFGESIQHLHPSNKINIELSKILNDDVPEEISFEIKVREIGEIRKIENKSLYFLEYEFKPVPSNFVYSLNLPPYSNRCVCWLVDKIACAMKKQGAYSIVSLCSKPCGIDYKNGQIDYRFSGEEDKFKGPASNLGILYRKAWKLSLGSLIIGITIGCVGSMLAMLICG